MLNVDSNVSSMSSHMSEQIELLIFTEQILSDLLISVTGTLRLKYLSPLRSVQRHRPRLPSPLRSLPVPSVFFYFLNISTVFTPSSLTQYLLSGGLWMGSQECFRSPNTHRDGSYPILEYLIGMFLQHQSFCISMGYWLLRISWLLCKC